MATYHPSKYKSLDLPIKYEILQKLRKCESATKVADTYNKHQKMV